MVTDRVMEVMEVDATATRKAKLITEIKLESEIQRERRTAKGSSKA